MWSYYFYQRDVSICFLNQNKPESNISPRKLKQHHRRNIRNLKKNIFVVNLFRDLHSFPQKSVHCVNLKRKTIDFPSIFCLIRSGIQISIFLLFPKTIRFKKSKNKVKTFRIFFCVLKQLVLGITIRSSVKFYYFGNFFVFFSVTSTHPKSTFFDPIENNIKIEKKKK